ncbi:uncharacterized protein LOC131037062 [Cryptomeria japonica]|uniref:uncharacterized protein LOC131037062 n=1 Tax=Cryptomeria japonica TaxID=3369 RepID=UPI0027DA8F5A|nr:uncharacterized protein LOC131037062 [Cryptomeria japonica]
MMGKLLFHPPKLGPRMLNYRGNIDDALGKLQALIDAAADVPPSQVDQKIKKIEKLAEIIEKKGLKTKIMHSLKKAGKRKKGS